MSKDIGSLNDKTWALIDAEKRRDRFLRRLSVGAWAVTLLVLVGYGVLTGMQVYEMFRASLVGMVPFATVVGMATPFIIVLGAVCLLVATMATIGVFLRLRTASLNEIQLRLAALEELVVKSQEAR